MTLTNKFTIFSTANFEEELQNIIYYISYKLAEPMIANKFYDKVIKTIYSLQYLPERYLRVSDFVNKKRNLRRLLIDNYTIIYEVNNNTRTGFYFTYFSLQSKLF